MVGKCVNFLSQVVLFYWLHLSTLWYQHWYFFWSFITLILRGDRDWNFSFDRSNCLCYHGDVLEGSLLCLGWLWTCDFLAMVAVWIKFLFCLNDFNIERLKLSIEFVEINLSFFKNTTNLNIAANCERKFSYAEHFSC